MDESNGKTSERGSSEENSGESRFFAQTEMQEPENTKLESKKRAVRGHHKLNQDELDQIDREILRLLVEKPSRTLTEIGATIGMGFRQVYIRKTRPIFVRTLAELQKSAIQIVMDSKAEAVREIRRLAKNAKSESVRLQASMALAADVLPAMQIKHSGRVEHTVYDGIRFVRYSANGEEKEEQLQNFQSN